MINYSVVYNILIDLKKIFFLSTINYLHLLNKTKLYLKTNHYVNTIKRQTTPAN